MAVDSSEKAQYINSLPGFPDESPTNLQCDSKLAILSFLEVLNPFKSQMCSDAKLNCQDYIKADAYSPCSIDVDIENGNKEIPVTTKENVISLEAEDSLTHMQRVMHREISLQLLIEHSLMLLKFTSRDKSAIERVHDTHTPNNRWRKYKRAASFDSRKIVLLFSVLSSMGTMILIYLTLRVKQMGDASVPL